MKILERLKFWIWHKDYEQRLRGNPFQFAWTTRVETVYKPLFEKGGMTAVLKEHKEYIARQKARLELEKDADADKPFWSGGGE